MKNKVINTVMDGCCCQPTSFGSGSGSGLYSGGLTLEHSTEV